MIQVSQNELLSAIKAVKGAVASRSSSMPILKHVLIDAQQDSLVLTATDLSMAIRSTCYAQTGDDALSLAVPAQILLDLVSGAGDDVTLEQSGTKLKVASGTHKATIHGIAAEEFPIIPTMENPMTMKARILLAAVSRVIFAASTDEYRPILSGILFRCEDGHLLLGAADGFRLSMETCDVDLPNVTAIIPACAMNQVVKAAKNAADIELALTKSQAFFRANGVTVITQLLVGIFPDLAQVVPSSCKTRVVVDTKQLLSALRLAVFARESNFIVRLNIKHDSMDISSSSAESGKGLSTIPIQEIDGPPLEVAFNVNYLTQAITAAGTEQIAMEFAGDHKPLKLHVDNWVHALMPMNLDA
ncbi:MAG: DNA polymerase III subunit beta [Methanophagales archaeon]|nr:DNA polymerase III subunit beta [Methanophagales archaeon]